MPRYLCITTHFLSPSPTFHGSGDSDESEWPPSPARLLQALVSAATDPFDLTRIEESAKQALAWLARLPSPLVVAPDHTVGTGFRLSVPNNDLDVTARLWWKGVEPEKPKRPIDLRTMKAVRPVHLRSSQGNDATVHYLYPLPDACPDLEHHLPTLRTAARSITHLGWGIDMVAGNAELLTDEQVAQLPGERWEPASDRSGTPLRVPVSGTLDALIRRHTAFLNRLSEEGFRPVPPLTAFQTVNYRRASDPMQRPYTVLQLVSPDGSPFSYPQDKLIHIRGMVRHLAIEAMKREQPRGVPEDWVNSYVRGKARPGEDTHRQFSYLPLPSIGHTHTDPSIRRVMITSPPGDEGWLKFLENRLLGQQLVPDPECCTLLKSPPILTRPSSHSGFDRYVQTAKEWASVTPVILPGHDDHSPAKTRKLIEKALAQSGVNVPCEYEWRAISWFPKSLPAFKYDRHKRPIGYFRPSHLVNLTAVHLRLTFESDYTGPLVIGAGRHCGLGLLATLR
jgi:CRISPR-associated protein Csb2